MLTAHPLGSRIVLGTPMAVASALSRLIDRFRLRRRRRRAGRGGLLSARGGCGGGDLRLVLLVGGVFRVRVLFLRASALTK
jgi:hypothetical protein